MKRKRSLVIAGHSTSISLEDAFWEALQQMAIQENLGIAALVEKLDRQRALLPQADNLSSYLRVCILTWYQNKK